MRRLLQNLATLPGRNLTLCAALLAGLCIGFATPFAALSQQNLPEMGEPADTALSPAQEQEMGAQFMRQIRARLPLVNDTQSREYLQALGTRLVRSVEGGSRGAVDPATTGDPGSFEFFLISDPTINAFAIPGGFVGVNTGLIDAMRTEEQLAGVLAHEIAHVTQRHHARAYATSGRSSLSAAASILAAILIGQASPEAGQAALAAGLAATQQSAVNFTRNNEIEADRVGIDLLKRADYPAIALAQSFTIMRQANSLNTSRDQLEYLRTHPLDNNRIAEAEDRAAQQAGIPEIPQVDYRLFKARLTVLSSDDDNRLMRRFRAEHDKRPDAGSAYALTFLMLRANRVGNELDPWLASLEARAANHPMAELLLAEVEFARGQSRAGRQRLQNLLSLYPNQYSVVEALLSRLGEKRESQKALALLDDYLRYAPQPDPVAWRERAGILQRVGDRSGSHESLANWFEALGEWYQAHGQLELAIRQVPAGSQDELRLRARLNNIEREHQAELATQ